MVLKTLALLELRCACSSLLGRTSKNSQAECSCRQRPVSHAIVTEDGPGGLTIVVIGNVHRVSASVQTRQREFSI
jgi:hypothetical protein